MGGDMRELIDAEQVGRLFAALAVLLPPVSALAGCWFGSRRKMARRGALVGILIGLIGPLNLALWFVYNKITDAAGLDTVRNLVINVTLFLVAGTAIGIGAGLVMRRIDAALSVQPADKTE